MSNLSLMSRRLNQLLRTTTSRIGYGRGNWEPVDLNKLEDLPESEIRKAATFKPPVEPAQLETVLQMYGATTTVLDFWIGPSVTTYEVKLPDGFRLESFMRFDKDIARDLRCQSIRILPSMKNSSNIGIEVENSKRFAIDFKQIIKGLPANMTLPIILGEDTFGDAVYSDLVNLPHLLVAGTTGSGKSVWLNSVILTMLATKSPADVRLLLVDPKVVEFREYAEVPHLLKPIATDAEAAIDLIQETVNIMEERFQMLCSVPGAKKLSDYNEAMDEHLPYILFIIDEYADLITGGSKAEAKEIEGNLKRIAQKARAVGIHMIAATQKPNREVVTPLLKANLPARIAFSVTSGMDSRVILDCMGAEHLAGKGDMLFKDPTARNELMGLRRIQSPMVSRADTETILNG